MRPLRVYLDTSVFGGCFDQEFAEDSLRVLDAVRSGKLIVVISDVLVTELARAPDAVRQLVSELPPEVVEVAPTTVETDALRDAYIAAGILGRTSIADATHVAVATVARVDAIVSWNFRHIVRLDKIRAYNQVNLLNGYGILTIASPKEVRFDDET